MKLLGGVSVVFGSGSGSKFRIRKIEYLIRERVLKAKNCRGEVKISRCKGIRK